MKISKQELHSLRFQIAQLRHAYKHLTAERVVKQAMFADGLISPAIEAFERLADAADLELHESAE